MSERNEEKKPEARRVSALSLAALGLSLVALLLACAALVAGGLAASRPVRVSVEVVYPTPEATSTARSESWSHPVPIPPSRTPQTPSHSESHTEGHSLPPLEMTECLVFSDSVYAACPGRDRQEKLRNCIRDLCLLYTSPSPRD